jgi:hypothetical protein
MTQALSVGLAYWMWLWHPGSRKDGTFLEVDMHTVNGGTAFPVVGSDQSKLLDSYGMTLRDYFAGQALSSGMYEYGKQLYGDMACWAYQVADAMIAERGKA